MISHFYAVYRQSGKSLFSNAVFIALAGIIPALLGYLYWAFAARFTTPDEIGVASALLSAATFITLIFGLDLGTILIRELPQSQDPTKLLNTCLFLRSGLAVLGAVLFLLILTLWTNRLSFIAENFLLGLGFVFSSIIFSINELVSHIFVAYRSAAFATIRNTYVAVIRFVPVVLGVILSAKLTGVDLYAAIIFGAIVGLIITFRRQFHRANIPFELQVRMDIHDIRRVASISLLNFVGAIALQAPVSLMPLMILNIVGSEESGVGYIVMTIATLSILCTEAIARSLFSEGTHEPELIKSNLKKSLISGTAISLIMFLGSLWVGDFVLRVSFGKVYAERGTQLLTLLILAALPIAIIQNNLAMLRLQNRMRTVAIIGLTVGVVSLIAMYFLMHRHGLTGGGIGFLIGNSVGAILSLPGIMSIFRASHVPTNPYQS
ncbi:MAG: hypothetical protein K8L91_07490 [Anaerolineae bacterium]|nr:hypothetical protein [Anaerolineae bacterium]